MSRSPARVALLLPAIMLILGAVAATAATPRETIERLEQEFVDAILARDEAALDRLIAADYTYGGIRVLDKREHIDLITSVIPPKTQTIDDMDVKLYGDSAVVTGTATTESVSPAGAKRETFRWVNVWVRGEHGWQVVYAQTTVMMTGDGC